MQTLEGVTELYVVVDLSSTCIPSLGDRTEHNDIRRQRAFCGGNGLRVLTCEHEREPLLAQDACRGQTDARCATGDQRRRS